MLALYMPLAERASTASIKCSFISTGSGGMYCIMPCAHPQHGLLLLTQRASRRLVCHYLINAHEPISRNTATKAKTRDGAFRVETAHLHVLHLVVDLQDVGVDAHQQLRVLCHLRAGAADISAGPDWAR